MNLALVGEKLGHSLSPAIHRAYCQMAGEEGRYGLLELTPGQIGRLPQIMREKGLDGVNVTIPYKKAVLPVLDGLTDTARRVGAVNTIARRDGRLLGHNTDLGGFTDMLRFAGIRIPGGRFAVLGATGGAAQAVLAALEDGGAAQVYRVSRRGPVRYGELAHLPFNVLVNCTPVGMWPQADQSPVAASVAERAEALVDLVYNPRKTRFLSQAAPGAIAIGGLYMLVAQAVRAQAFWRDEPENWPVADRIYAGLAEGEMSR